jgi:hypothetical protein
MDTNTNPNSDDSDDSDGKPTSLPARPKKHTKDSQVNVSINDFTKLQKPGAESLRKAAVATNQPPVPAQATSGLEKPVATAIITGHKKKDSGSSTGSNKTERSVRAMSPDPGSSFDSEQMRSSISGISESTTGAGAIFSQRGSPGRN